MSGQAGARFRGTYGDLFVGSGINVCLAPPPGAEGNYHADYFERESRPYERWLAVAGPLIDDLLARAKENGLPLAPIDPPGDQRHGVIVEDTRPVRTDDELLAKMVLRSKLDALAADVARTLFETAENGPMRAP